MSSSSMIRHTVGSSAILAVLLPFVGLTVLLALSFVRWTVGAADVAGDVQMAEADFEAWQARRGESTEDEREFFAIASAVTALQEKYAPLYNFFIQEGVRSEQQKMYPWLHQFAEEADPIWTKLIRSNFKLDRVRFRDANAYYWSYSRPFREVSDFLSLLLLAAASQKDAERALDVIRCHHRVMGPAMRVPDIELESNRLGNLWGFMLRVERQLSEEEGFWDANQLEELRRLSSAPLARPEVIRLTEVNRWQDMLRDGRQSYTYPQRDPFQDYAVAPSVRANLLAFLQGGRIELTANDASPGLDGLIQFPFIRFIPGPFASGYRYSNSVAANLDRAEAVQQRLLVAIESSIQRQEKRSSVEERE